jgi:hypothetical protein
MKLETWNKLQDLEQNIIKLPRKAVNLEITMNNLDTLGKPRLYHPGLTLLGIFLGGLLERLSTPNV